MQLLEDHQALLKLPSDVSAVRVRPRIPFLAYFEGVSIGKSTLWAGATALGGARMASSNEFSKLLNGGLEARRVDKRRLCKSCGGSSWHSPAAGS